MKKMTLKVVFSAIALTVITGIAAVSCQKESITKNTAENSTEAATKKPVKPTSQEKIEQAYGNATASGGCRGAFTCSWPGLAGFTPYNSVTIAKNSYTITNYPASMKYTIYVRGTHISGNVYNLIKVDEMTCSQNSPIYSGPLLNNSTTYYVLITQASTMTSNTQIDMTGFYPLIQFTTGNYKTGQPC